MINSKACSQPYLRNLILRILDSKFKSLTEITLESSENLNEIFTKLSKKIFNFDLKPKWRIDTKAANQGWPENFKSSLPKSANKYFILNQSSNEKLTQRHWAYIAQCSKAWSQFQVGVDSKLSSWLCSVRIESNWSQFVQNFWQCKQLIIKYEFFKTCQVFFSQNLISLFFAKLISEIRNILYAVVLYKA